METHPSVPIHALLVPESPRREMSRKRTLLRASIALISVVLLATASTACRARGHTDAAPILLFAGTGTSPGDVAALETILNTTHLAYDTVSSAELNSMAADGLRRYRLLIVPGGNFVDMGNGLTARTTMNIRDGVQHGLNYLGICAGAFLAGSFPPPYNHFNLTSGVQFGFYAAA